MGVSASGHEWCLKSVPMRDCQTAHDKIKPSRYWIQLCPEVAQSAYLQLPNGQQPFRLTARSFSRIFTGPATVGGGQRRCPWGVTAIGMVGRRSIRGIRKTTDKHGDHIQKADKMVEMSGNVDERKDFKCHAHLKYRLSRDCSRLAEQCSFLTSHSASCLCFV